MPESSRVPSPITQLKSQLITDPDNPRLLFMLGLEEIEAGDWAAAIRSFERVVAMVPDVAAAHFNLGLALFESGEHRASIDAYERALKIHEDWETLDGLGKSLAASGLYESALSTFHKAANLPELNRQKLAISLRNIAFTHVHSGDWHQSRHFFQQAVEQDWSERNLECLFSSFNALGLATSVLEWIEQLRTRSTNVRLGTRVIVQESKALHALGRHRDALEKLIEDTENPSDGDALFAQIANAHLLLGHTSEALGCVHKLVTSNPNSWVWNSEWIRVLNFANNVTPERIFRNAKVWAEQVAKACQPQSKPEPVFTNDSHSPVKRIAILLNADCDHVLKNQVVPWLRSRSRDLSHVTIVWDHWGECRRSELLRSMVDQWQPVALWSDKTLSQWCAAQKMDLFVDCVGHGAKNRLGVTRMHPAKRHVLWNYQLQTSGLPEMDYVIHDSAVASRLDKSFVSESILAPEWLGFCANDPIDGEGHFGKTNRIKTNEIRFGFLGDLAYVSPETLDLWAGVMASSPGSVMAIRTPEFCCKSTIEDTQNALGRRGCPPGRIFIENWTADSSVQNWLDDVDVFLDSAPANHLDGVSMAISRGIPIVSLAGKRPLELVTTALRERGVEGVLVADSFEQYVELAIFGANATNRHKVDLSTRLPLVNNCDLFDEQRYATSIDQLFCLALP